MIRIRRRSWQYVDRLRSYEIVLDGSVIGRINMGEVFEYQPLPGSHTLQLKIDWCGSPKVDFEIDSDEVIDFECGGLSGFKLLFALWITIFQKDSYLWLTNAGKYNKSDMPLLNNVSARLANSVQVVQKWRFVFRNGVLGWGIGTGIVFQILRLITGTRDTPVDWILTLLIFMVMGLFWGLVMWNVVRRREHVHID